MKRDCSTCICKEGSCYPSTTIFDKDKTCKSYDPDYEGYIAELEKENAELKKTVTKMNNVITETFSKLTKAKDLLKRCYENYIYLEPLRSEIEQFLSEVEK